MSDNKAFNGLYLLIIILIVGCLALISGIAIGIFSATSNQSVQITENSQLQETQIAENTNNQQTLINNNCTRISNIPYTIQSSGHYCLTENLTTDSDGITIMTDNVLLDFNGYSIHGSQDPNNTFYGIYANDQSNLHIKNGEITGFFYAIRIDDSAYGLGEPYQSGWHTIENMEISYSTFRGIVINGNANVVQNNIIRHIQGNTFYEDSFAIGIESTGLGALVQNNFIYEIRGTGVNDIAEGVGISLTDYGSGSVITNNIITNNGLEESNLTDWQGLSRSTWGIWVGGINNVIISSNQIHNYAYGIGLSATTGSSLIHNNTITMYYTPINLGTLNRNDHPHILAGNICETENCVSPRIFPTRTP